MRLGFQQRTSPIGDMLIAWDDGGALHVLDFVEYDTRMRTLLRLQCGACELVEGQAPLAITEALGRYFGGEVTAIDCVPVKIGGTAFQQQVWAALRTIPAGTTESYGGLAHRLGRPKAVRAVGGANGANPVGIVVPCHRVIGANGALTGYGGGIERKKWLLAHEAAHASTGDLFSRHSDRARE